MLKRARDQVCFGDKLSHCVHVDEPFPHHFLSRQEDGRFALRRGVGVYGTIREILINNVCIHRYLSHPNMNYFNCDINTTVHLITVQY